MVVPHPRVGSHALLTRSPVSTEPKSCFSFDLHVLSLPPAFVLSQDQTLMLNQTSITDRHPTNTDPLHSKYYSLARFCPNQTSSPVRTHKGSLKRDTQNVKTTRIQSAYAERIHQEPSQPVIRAKNSTNRRPRIPSKIYLSNNRTRRTGAYKKAWPRMANAKDAASTRRDA